MTGINETGFSKQLSFDTPANPTGGTDNGTGLSVFNFVSRDVWVRVTLMGCEEFQ